MKKQPETYSSDCFVYGADDRGRTGTDFTPLDFESSASANSTTSALATINIISCRGRIVNTFFMFFGRTVHYA